MSVHEHWPGRLQRFVTDYSHVLQQQYSGLSPRFEDESKLDASIKEEIIKLHAGSKFPVSKMHAYFQVDSYGDLQFSEANLKFANFYEVGKEYMLGLQMGHETATSKVAGADQDAPLSSCSYDDGVGVNEPAAMSTSPYYSCRIRDLMELKSTKYVTAPDVEFDIEASKPTWTQLDPDADFSEASSSDDDDWGDAERESNQVEFDRLKEHPDWGPFFRNNQYSSLRRGALLGKGGQANVYEAIDIRDSERNLVVKVFNKGFRLRQLQKWWPRGLMKAADSQISVVSVPYICWALGAQVLKDDSFAFVFPRLKCDLRKRIDDAMLKRNGTGPPFSPFTCFCIISDIAAGMAYLHNRNLTHRDLKAANVLDMRNVSKDQTCIMMLIADFESSAGVSGTFFWRAPEILRQLYCNQSNGGRKRRIKFTKEADVYSFAMTCYEVVTGLLPFEGRSALNVDGVIDGDERPELPLNICPELRDLICRCWSSDPRQRPSFNTIRTDLMELGNKAWNSDIRYKKLLHFAPGKIFKEETRCVKHIDWELPVYDQSGRERKLRATNDRLSTIFETENKILKAVPASEMHEDDPDFTPFEVTFEHDGPMPNTVTILLKSPNLIQVAKQCLPSPELFSIDSPTIDANDMFIALQAFKDAHQSNIQGDVDHEAKAQYWELKHLLRFLEAHYKDTTAKLEKMRQEKKVSFDLLWAFFYKGQKVHYTCAMTGQTLQGIVTLAQYQKKFKRKFVVKLECRDYNGWKYVKGSVKVSVKEFDSETSFQSIGIGPMSLLEQSKVAEKEAMFLRNGRKFHNIVAQGSTYMQYVGPRIFRDKDYINKFRVKKQKADGRVMVDLISFARTNPDFPLGNAKPPSICNVQIAGPCGDQQIPSDEELMLAPAVVYGFSFSNKLWGGFDVNGFSEIHFDDQAFGRDLVLSDSDKKDMLLALVTQYLKDPTGADNTVPKIDPISNKGDGCIFLCYGPPGTGKTLTAESIAEKLHRPLWSVSVSELGVKPKKLETKLMEILDIASQWRAVLLLDEADLYLEKRTSNSDPNRTAMTATFLRVLEYYRGVLFLTTNRVASFDDAFRSRISMFLRYHRLSSVQRVAVWRSLLSRAQIQNPDPTLFRDYELNGREIRNCIRIAQTFSRNSGDELTIDHVLKVVDMPVESRQDLEASITEKLTNIQAHI